MHNTNTSIQVSKYKYPNTSIKTYYVLERE